MAAGFAGAALVGLVMQVSIFRFMPGQDLRQTMVTIGLSIVIADLLLWVFGGAGAPARRRPTGSTARCAACR